MKRYFILIMMILMILSLIILSGCGEPENPPVGILSIEKTSSDGLVDTYTINFTDGSKATFTINNGENGKTPKVEIGENGNWFIDGEDSSVKAQAEQGLSAYELYIKYHPEFKGSEKEWINTFFVVPKEPNEIVSVTKTKTEGLVDTYTITFSDGSTTTFDINNGESGHTPVIEIGENGNWFIDSVDSGVKAQPEQGLSAYELYIKYHPEYTGSEEEWVNEFFHKETALEEFVNEMDISSYSAELKEYNDGILANTQVFMKSENNRYWKKIYNEYDIETGDYYPYPTEYYYITEDNDESYPHFLISLKRRDNLWYSIDTDIEIYYELNQCNMRKYQYSIDPTQFDKITSRHFIAKSEFVNEVGKAFFSDIDALHWGEVNGTYARIWRTEVFNSFEIEIVSGNLKIKATSTITDGDETEEASYELVLSKIGMTTVTIPKYQEVPAGGFPSDTIEDCYDKANGDEVINLSGYITGYAPYGDDDYKVWITNQKQTKSINVIFEGFGFPYGVEIGRNIIIYGTIDIYENGLRRIIVNRDVDYELQGSMEIVNQEVKDISRITSYMENDVIDFSGVSLDKTHLTESDSVYLTDRSGNTFELWISYSDLPLFNQMCKNLVVGDDVNLKNIAIAYDDTGLYARITKQSEVSFEYGILLSYSTKTINANLSIEEALSDLVVNYRKDNGQYIHLDKEDYTITVCEEFDPTKNGNYEVIVSYNDEEVTIILTYYLPEIRVNVSYPTLEKTAEENLYEILPSLPSEGDVNILVIPIGFTNSDYSKYGSEDDIKQKLEIAFNDTEGRTGWYSLKEYYQKASYGKLNLNARILDIYQTGEAYDLYSGETDVDDWRYLIGALNYFDDEIDYSLYDQNNDWCIDCVYMVYLAPICDIYDDDQSDLWWAYYYYDSDYEEYFDDTYVYGYLWMSFEYFDEPIDAVYSDYGVIDEENSLYVDINCEAVIHETGHALGLADYYDYKEGGVKGGVGYFAMMHANQGDHDPYSKAILGWTQPTVVVNMDYETTLHSFEETGDTIILSKTNGGTYFEEYYMIAFYTPTGVNELKCDRNCGLPSVSGIMVWHIDATLRSQTELWMINSVTDITEYNNGDAKHKLINLILADGSNDIDKFVDYMVQDKDLFAEESTVSGLKWYDGTDVGVEINVGTFVDVDGTEQVTISINY